jgi:hypothetical protein
MVVAVCVCVCVCVVCTSKEVSDGHPPEVDGSGGEVRVEVLDEELELLGKGGGADGLACRGEPQGQRRVGRVFAEVGPHSLLEELNVKVKS